MKWNCTKLTLNEIVESPCCGIPLEMWGDNETYASFYFCPQCQKIYNYTYPPLDDYDDFYVLPTDQEKIVKVVLENDGCEKCLKFEEEYKRDDPKVTNVLFECDFCGRKFIL